jgi:hypothetical protein
VERALCSLPLTLTLILKAKQDRASTVEERRLSAA